MKVKLCGFSEELSLRSAIDCGADFVGFVFCEKSPRNISLTRSQTLGAMVPSHVAKVAVVVDESLENLEKIAQSLQPQYFQLHGSENLERVLVIKKHFPNIKIIKAFGVATKSDLEQSLDFIDVADIFLFDNIKSGSGKSFDFEILQNFSCKKNWFLSGGININNIEEALKTTGAKMVDVSSGIEKERGKKSSDLIKEFMQKAKNVN